MVSFKKEKNISHRNYTDDLALLGNIRAQAKSLLHSLDQATRSIGFYMNSDKTKFMCFKQNRAFHTLNNEHMKLVGQFT